MNGNLASAKLKYGRYSCYYTSLYFKRPSFSLLSCKTEQLEIVSDQMFHVSLFLVIMAKKIRSHTFCTPV